MRKLFSATLLLCAALIISSWAYINTNQKAQRKFLVTGSIMETVSYCGGAAPPQQLLDSLNTPKGIPYGKLFVKRGTTNIEGAKIICIIKADAKGSFSVYLPAGAYSIVEEWKAKPFKIPENNDKQTVDSACYRTLYNTSDFNLNIDAKNVRDVKIIFHRNCPYNQPCVSFHGPLPPSNRPHHQ